MWGSRKTSCDGPANKKDFRLEYSKVNKLVGNRFADITSSGNGLRKIHGFRAT